ncbi:hypothetical protein M9Y10_013581 [Tritrichomonas musculus]|uniref:Uncharacterized protein n=1 Tax=Tritrichomonas musculus TaxID=1915356 RepID=A0ABR2KZ38_9EUKA
MKIPMRGNNNDNSNNNNNSNSNNNFSNDGFFLFLNLFKKSLNIFSSTSTNDLFNSMQSTGSLFTSINKAIAKGFQDSDDPVVLHGLGESFPVDINKAIEFYKRP